MAHAWRYADLVSRVPYALVRRGIALQRDDIPMRPSVDFPTESEVELELPAPPEEEKKA